LLPGEVLAVVGPSAAGKTTLARLIVGLWPAAAGKVRLDGADVFSWDKTELGPHIGYLPQDVELLDGTLAENIARFGEVRPSKVKAAAMAVDLHAYITSRSDPKARCSRAGSGSGLRWLVRFTASPRWWCSTSRTQALTTSATPHWRQPF
jgi:ABC-type multidrug transport system fused ATPase/permease subunit